ncbi:MAG: hypothetical protein Tsb0020_27120 [Haliangiales bacterium]
MKSLYAIICTVSLSLSLTACAFEPYDDAELLGESSAALAFKPGDPDITWSGPASYSAKWAQDSFKSHPGLYILRLGSTAMTGAVYLSAKVLCRFSSIEETSQHIFIQSDDCSGPFTKLRVRLDCTKENGDLSCVGELDTAGGLQSDMYTSIERESVCSPGNCFIGPLDPLPPGPDGPADCGDGESPCGGGCCLRGERCGDGSCYIPEEGDDTGIRETL